MSSQLPPNPNLSQLKLRAKELRKAYLAGDAEAITRTAPFLPDMTSSPEAELSHRDAQFIIAREYGFASWPKLKQHVEALHPEEAGKDLNDHFREMRALAQDVLGEWFYPDTEYGGGGWSDDRHFVHIEGRTSDSLEQVREFYWKMCEWTHDRSVGDGGSSYFMDRYPQRIFRNGPPMIVVHATKERTLSIFAVPLTTENQIALYITREDH